MWQSSIPQRPQSREIQWNERPRPQWKKCLLRYRKIHIKSNARTLEKIKRNTVAKAFSPCFWQGEKRVPPRQNPSLTHLSPICSTRQLMNAVWPTRVVMLRGTSKSKYGCGENFLMMLCCCELAPPPPPLIMPRRGRSGRRQRRKLVKLGKIGNSSACEARFRTSNGEMGIDEWWGLASMVTDSNHNIFKYARSIVLQFE